jgi:hypothetical protein
MTKYGEYCRSIEMIHTILEKHGYSYGSGDEPAIYQDHEGADKAVMFLLYFLADSQYDRKDLMEMANILKGKGERLSLQARYL